MKYVRITGNGSIDAVEALSDASVDPSPFDAGPGADAATFDAAL